MTVAAKPEESGVSLIQHPALRIVNYVLLVLCALIVFVPISIVFLQSFKSNQEYIYSKVWDLPKNFLNLDNYQIVFKQGHLAKGFLNTNILAFVSLFGTLAMGTMVSYVLTRFEFRGKSAVLTAYVLSAIVPGTTTLIATFKVIQALHLYNSIWAGIALYVAAGVLDIYVFLQFASKIPKELDESAMMDGASYFQIYWKIILPQMQVALVTTGILKIAYIYNDMFIPFVFMPGNNLNTLTTGLMKFTYDRNSQWNVMAAGIMMIMIPTLVLYLFSQRYIVSGVSGGAVKG